MTDVEISDQFSTDTTGLPAATETSIVELADGDTFHLTIAPVVKHIGGSPVRMLAYNGSIPGPTLRVRQGSQIHVHVVNHTEMETTVHWHGLRLENRFDGVPHETQVPIPVGGEFSYTLQFPDAGLYWYHPHVREDYGLEMGLYANILVDPVDEDYWPTVDREALVTVDDLLLEDGKVAPFSRSHVTYTAMGRFGNILLASGQTDLTLDARVGEVLRLYLTNTANTRVFNVQVPGLRMKRVGGDSGRYEHEEWVDQVLLAPSERAVIDVLPKQPGELTLLHGTPDRTYQLATIAVRDDDGRSAAAGAFDRLRTNPDLRAERTRIVPYLEAEPDKILAFVAQMDMGEPAGDGPVSYACPMHPEVVSDEPGRCPKCGMKLLAQAAPAAYVCPMHPHITDDHPSKCSECGMKLVAAALVTGAGDHHMPEQRAGEHDAHQHEHAHGSGTGEGIEWEDDMVEVNRLTTPDNMSWQLVDHSDGAVNHHIDWRFRVGDQVKIRLVNEMDSDHPMHHPFHIHGAGRFLVLTRNGEVESNLVWKDTVLVRTGEMVDVLLDVSNPGLWMAHCHIAEHAQSGMMFSFTVDR
ncbi:MAG TPA: multicopper oxidase domain-containing protein [Frankiaceae bacterium]|nr:multicopper oxidase domain-containing protein [Frankiaceae bacterium]